LDFDRDAIISFGVVPIRCARIDVGDALYELVDPGDATFSPDAVAVHMLRPVDLRTGVPLAEAREHLCSKLDRRFLVTWHAGVEAAFLSKLYGRGVRTWLARSVDVRELVLEIDRLQQRRADSYALTDVAARFGVPVASPHHALDDALVTAQLFLVTASILSRFGLRTTKDLLRVRARRFRLGPMPATPTGPAPGPSNGMQPGHAERGPDLGELQP
jgi:DNA polymerase-3 subunit epsilon